MHRTLQDPEQAPFKDPLPGLKQQLKSEYDELPDEQSDRVARHALNKYTPAKVQGFVPVLAWRHAGRHLKRAS